MTLEAANSCQCSLVLIISPLKNKRAISVKTQFYYKVLYLACSWKNKENNLIDWYRNTWPYFINTEQIASTSLAVLLQFFHIYYRLLSHLNLQQFKEVRNLFLSLCYSLSFQMGWLYCGRDQELVPIELHLPLTHCNKRQ